MQTSLHVSKPTAYTRSSRQVRALAKNSANNETGECFSSQPLYVHAQNVL